MRIALNFEEEKIAR